jgi:hypothetical protein
MRKYLTIYEEAVSHIGMTLHPIPSEFLIYEENFLFFLYCYMYRYMYRFRGSVYKINTVQGGSDKSGILQICFQNGTAQLKIIRFSKTN